jgi:hypothetical protein
MWIAGIVLLFVAAGAAWYARSRRAQARSATATDTLTCAELGQLATGVGDEVGAGSFRQRCEVVGQGVVGEDGPLAAPHSQTKAIWYRGKVTHRYWTMERREHDGRTSWDRVEHEETVSELTSEVPFLIDDGSGGTPILVAPNGADVDAPEQTVDRFEPGTGPGDGGGGGLLNGMLNAAIRSGDRSGTIGFGYHEEIIRPGARLYVHGEASDAGGRVGFAKPGKGRFVISTRSEEELVGEAQRHAKWSSIGAIALAAIGVVLIVAGVATA